MKKIISIVLCLSMVICFAACSNAEEDSISYKTFDIDKYKVDLPETYEFNDLEEVKAEPNCVAMLTDKEGKLPELWIYVDDLEGDSVKDFIFSQDEKWDFKEIEIYEKNGDTLARTTFDEEWYGTSLKNESYYRVENGNKVLWFDFACEDKDGSDEMRSYVKEIAKAIGF